MEHFPTTVYRAMRRPDGRVVCVDAEYLPQTSKVVKDQRDLTLALSLGWVDNPTTAMERFEREQEALGNEAAHRAYTDRNMSDAAQSEVAAVEKTTIRHLPEIPIATKKRGRPRKVQPVG